MAAKRKSPGSPGTREMIHCPVCRSRLAPRYLIDRFDPAFEILRCPNCGLETQSKIPDDPGHLYDEDYYTGRAEYFYRDERNRRAFDRHVWDARLRHIARYVTPPADFVDVGCAFGGLVEAASDFGYQARGLDVSPFAVEDGRQRGLDVSVGMLEKSSLSPSSVDALTMIEVFEHITDPISAMDTLRSAMRPGGVVVIQTANFLGRQARHAGANYHYYLPGHFFYYNTHNLRLLFQRFGFSQVDFFRPVEFGLLPKLLKSRADFHRPLDYLKWFRIARYHLSGMIALGDWAWQSSMVAYAVRDGG